MCVQKVEREGGFGTEHRRRVPTDAQELLIVLGGSVLGTFAKTSANRVVAREVDDKNPLRFRGRGAEAPTVSKIDDETKALEGCALEKAVLPDLAPECL